MRACGKMCGKRQKEKPSVRRRRQGLAGSVGIRFRRGLPCGMLSGRYGPAGKSAFGRTDSAVRPYRPPSGQLICRRRCADRFREQHGKSERGRYGSVRRSDRQRADRTGPDAAERDGAPGYGRDGGMLPDGRKSPYAPLEGRERRLSDKAGVCPAPE